MKRISKWLFLLFCTVGILFAASVACFASTYSETVSVEYKNELFSQYAAEVKVPFVQDTQQDGVDTSSGDLNLVETDLTLPGKNGFDLTISRRFSSSTANKRYSYDSTGRQYYWPVMYCYQYRSTNGKVYWVAFPSEETMLEKAPTTLQYQEENMREAQIRQPDGSYVYPYDVISKLYTDQVDVTMTRIPNTFKEGDYEEYSNRFYLSDLDHGSFLLNWKLNLPSIRKTINKSITYDDYTVIYYYGEFWDGESTYSFDYGRRYNRKTGVYDIIEGSVSGKDVLRKYTIAKSELTDRVATENNLGNYFCMQRSDGVTFYFEVMNGTTLGQSDRFGNFISIRNNGTGCEIVDTMGRHVSISTDGIKVVENGTERWPVRYSVTHAPYAPDPVLDTKTPYVLRVEKTEQYGASPVTSATTYDMYKRERLVPRVYRGSESWPITYYEIRKITYPTGAYAEYSYDKVKIFDALAGSTTYKIEKSRVNKSVIHNGTQANTYQYTYDKPKDGWSTEGAYINGIRKENYRYSSTKKNLTDNVTHTYTFDWTERVIKDVASDKMIPTIEYEYGTRRIGPPIKVTETNQKHYAKQKHITEASYNDSLQCTRQKDGDYEMNATYNACDLLLTQTYKRDADTTIQIRNTESADKKTIIKSEILENDVVKSVTDYEYDSFGNASKQTVHPSDAESNVTEFAYTYNADGTSSMTSTAKNVADADGVNASDLSTSVYYDFWGNATQTTDARANSTSATYDALGRPLTGIFPDGTTTGTYYNTPNNYVEYTQQNGSKIKYQYDALGNLKTLYLQQGGVYRKAADFAYDALGRKVSETEYRAYNASGTCTERYSTTYTYDVRSRVTETTTKDVNNAVVFQKTYTYDEASSPTYNYVTQSITGDATLTPAKLKSQYDLKGRLMAEQVLNGSEEYQKTEYTYDFLDNLLTATDDRARDNSKPFTVRYAYDYANRAISETDIDGNVKQTAYDAAGRKISDTDKLGNTISYFYDAAGRLVKTTAPLDDMQTSETKTYYDANGNVIKTLTAAGNGLWNAQSMEYDAMNRPVTVKGYPEAVAGPDLSNAASEVSASYTYNAVGSVLTQGGASSQTFAYNDLNQPVTITDAEGNSETYEYSLLGLPLKKTDRKGVVTSFTYNVWKSPLSISASYGGETQQISYGYDLLGNRTSMTDETGTTTYSYDFLNRLTQEENGGIMKAYEYDAYNNRTSFALTAQGVQELNLSYSYDLQNRLKSVTESGETTTYSYDANGNLLSGTTASAASVSYGYNKANLPVSQTNQAGGTTIASYGVSYYPNGNRSQITETNRPATAYTYDGMGRLKTEEVAGTYRNTYSYDARQNRSQKLYENLADSTSKQTSYTYDANNRLLKEVEESGDTQNITDYTYDPNGNQISKLYSTLSPAQDLETELSLSQNSSMAELFGYDLLGRLKESTTGGKTTAYTYDGDGLRQSKTTDGVTTTHIYDGQNIVMDTVGTVTQTYIRGNGLVAMKNSGAKAYYHFNVHGDTSALTNSAGTVTTDYRYDAFGNQLTQNENDTNPFRYCGEYFDNETGSIYLRARYYDPAAGRFLSEDPIKDGLNWYVYAGNNPVMFFDPMGLAEKLRDLVNQTSGKVDWIGSNDIRGWVEKNTAYVTIDGKEQKYNVKNELVYVNGTQVGYIENDSIMIEEEDFNRDFNIVGTITIYAYWDPQDPDAISSGDGYGGHSFISYQPNGEGTTFYGTWSESSTTNKGINVNNTWERDEASHDYRTAKFSRRITNNQHKKMQAEVDAPSNNTWSYINNCSTFANRVFSRTTGISFTTAGDFSSGVIGVMTPQKLKKRIQEKAG